MTMMLIHGTTIKTTTRITTTPQQQHGILPAAMNKDKMPW
jgi:hypothetical protein